MNNIGIRAKIYPNINSNDLVLVTYNLVKKQLLRSILIKIPLNNVKKVCEKTTIPGTRYLTSNCGVRLWKIK